jgi:hypothetical protein
MNHSDFVTFESSQSTLFKLQGVASLNVFELQT